MGHLEDLEALRRRNLHRLLAPASIAVVGASADPAKAGSQALRSLAEFPGRLVAVHPREREIQGRPCYPSLAALPEPVDLAVLAIPAEHCVAAAEEAAARGVGGLFIISGGFGESGAAGLALQARLQVVCRRTGLRLLGPNTSGFVNPGARCVASFVPGTDGLREGGIAVVAQSGGVNLSLAFLADRLGEGVSLAVGLGNAVDVDAADVIELLADDEGTRAIALHLEGVPRGRALHAAIGRATQRKPVVALVAGRADVGEFAVSHTGNLMGSRARTVAALTQAGAVVVDSTEELVQAAAVLRAGRLPPRERASFALITGQAGPGLLIADGLRSAGVAMPELGAATIERVRALLPPLTYLKNPVDTGRPGPGFGAVVQAVAEDEVIDAVLVYGLHEPAVLDPAAVLPPVVASVGKPVLFGSLGLPDAVVPARAALRSAGLPMVESPERLVLAARVLAADARARWGREQAAASELQAALPVEPAGQPWDEDRAKALLVRYGISVPQRRLCNRRDEALLAYRTLGAPVVVKVVSAEIAHKTEAGGVHLGIRSEAALQLALDAIERIPTRGAKAFLVEQMAPEGVELIVGGVQDPSWGPCVMVGLGGVMAEALADSAVRPAPLTRADVDEMLDSLQGRALLDGFRHLPRCDRSAIAEAVLGVARLLVEQPQLQEVEINPLRAGPRGALALDSLVVERPAPEAATPPRS
jgi:acetate---CoA ligase (ADP-forming)